VLVYGRYRWKSQLGYTVNVRCLLAAFVAITAQGCGRVNFDDYNDAAIVPNEAGIVPDAATDLALYFPMDEDPSIAQRLVAEPMSATVSCAPKCPTATTGRVGSGAYRFDGVTRVQIVPSPSAIISDAPYTIAMWLRPSATPGLFGCAFSKPIFAVDRTVQGDGVLNDVSLNVSDSVAFEGATPAPQTLVVAARAANNIRGSWHHIAAIWDGSNRTLFVDGVERDSIAGPFRTSLEPIALGTDLDNGALAVGYDGDIDDLRIYNRALSAVEVATLFAM
jgi:hypothetical protein